eukprot:m.175405 g.175405  ORF g.175405 m.175405 type:complete len:50 (-) comp13514_c4_seq2:1917-2066(-)
MSNISHLRSIDNGFSRSNSLLRSSLSAVHRLFEINFNIQHCIQQESVSY